MFIEFELGLVNLGIVPLLMSFRSLMRKELVGHIAIVLAVVCFVVGIILFKSAQG
jgi:multisubunit Na+/H+ antiporter MnhF subunit